MFLPGMIILWFGGFATIPAGWLFCDGTNGTPDLRGKFVRAVGGGFAAGATGGSENHNHGFTADAHTHSTSPGTQIRSLTPKNEIIDTATVEGVTDNSGHAPTFHTLIYMMKA